MKMVFNEQVFEISLATWALDEGMSKSEFARRYLDLTLTQLASALSHRAMPKIGARTGHPGKLDKLARASYGEELSSLLQRWHSEGRRKAGQTTPSSRGR